MSENVKKLDGSPLMHANWLLGEGLLLCSLSRQLDEQDKALMDREMRAGRTRSATPSLMAWNMYERKLAEWEKRVTEHLEAQGFDPHKAA